MELIVKDAFKLSKLVIIRLGPVKTYLSRQTSDIRTIPIIIYASLEDPLNVVKILHFIYSEFGETFASVSALSSGAFSSEVRTYVLSMR